MSAYPQKSSLAAYRSVAAHSGIAAADPHRLIVMLMDGALERVSLASGAMQHGDGPARNAHIHRAVEIVQELQGSLNMEAGGEIAANLADLYDYACRQLVRANLSNQTQVLDEVAKLLRHIRDAWLQIQLTPERRP
jgi:flagellar secretion chaperone FliS